MKTPTRKITRDAFIYLEPKGKNKDDFAQCKTCINWTGWTCALFNKDQLVKATDSCALYAEGPAQYEYGEELNSVTPKEAGFVHGEVRCENCNYFDENTGICKLFQSLNEKEPTKFNLDTKVDAKGCCNAFTKIPGQ